MSVPFSKRGHNDFHTLDKAEDLLEYTAEICLRKKKGSVDPSKRETVIPARHWSWFTAPLLGLAHSAYKNLYFANEIDLDETTTQEMFEERRKRQKLAIASLQSMLPDISYAWRKFSVKESSIEYWGNLVNEVIDLAQRWSASDNRRFAELQSKKAQEGSNKS